MQKMMQVDKDLSAVPPTIPGYLLIETGSRNEVYLDFLIIESSLFLK